MAQCLSWDAARHDWVDSETCRMPLNHNMLYAWYAIACKLTQQSTVIHDMLGLSAMPALKLADHLRWISLQIKPSFLAPGLRFLDGGRLQTTILRQPKDYC